MIARTFAAIAVAVSAFALMNAEAFSQRKAQQQVEFTGQTTADMTLLRDAFENVKLVALGKFDCSSVDRVVSEVLPRSYEPPGEKKQEGATYERWTARFCGKDVPFLLTFWPAKEGGMMFSVGYPFPSDEKR